MPDPFPPGVTGCCQGRPRSRRREFLFAFHQVVEAITPMIPMRTMIQNWYAITEELKEPLRKRRTQEKHLLMSHITS